jgi:flagellar biosynthesis GTPase FlhF
MGPANFGIDPLSYVFVDERYLPEPVLVDRYVPPARNVTIVHVTQNITNYRVVNNQVVNHGVPVQTVERITGRAVPRVRVAEQTAPSRTAVRGGQVAIYRPPVPKAPAGGARAAAPRPGTTEQRPPAGIQHPTGPTSGTQRPPAAAPPSTTDPAELQRRHAQEQQALQAKEAQEREKLRQIQEHEKAAPPPNVSQQQLEKQHQAEQKAQAEHEQQQKQAQEQRQARERQAAQQHQQQQGQQHPQAKNDKEKKKPQDKQ